MSTSTGNIGYINRLLTPEREYKPRAWDVVYTFLSLFAGLWMYSYFGLFGFFAGSFGTHYALDTVDRAWQTNQDNSRSDLDDSFRRIKSEVNLDPFSLYKSYKLKLHGK